MFGKLHMEESINSQIGKNLIELTERIIFRNQPFENFSWPKEVTYKLLEKYHLYKDEIDEKIRKDLFLYFRLTAREQFGRLTGFSEPRSFYDRHPELIKSRDEFYEWCKTKEDTNYTPFISGSSGLNPGFDVNKIIKDTIRKRDPELKIAKKKPTYGARSFYKSISDDNKVYLGFERGSLRSFMSFMVGFEKPWIGFDIGKLFLCGQSCFDYMNTTESIGNIDGEKRRIIEYSKPASENLISIIHTALDLFEFLLPHLLKALKIKPRST
jgi:hypothetical protein